MINLLPYNRRLVLKARYKRRLIVVGLFCVTMAILPFLIVIGIMIFIKYSGLDELSDQYNKSMALRTQQGVTELSSDVKEINSLIGSFQKNLKNTKPVSDVIEKIIAIKPAAIKITNFDFKAVLKEEDILVIKGISSNRAEIIEYVNLLSTGESRLCKKVTVPVTTYTQKINVPFTISCTLQYETN